MHSMLPTQFINLLSIWITVSNLIESTLTAPNKDLVLSRHQKGYNDCFAGWIIRMNLRCTYPGQSEPCFIEHATKATRIMVEDMARDCCNTKCLNNDIEKACCRYMSCLTKCYPSIRAHREHKISQLQRSNKFLHGLRKPPKF